MGGGDKVMNVIKHALLFAHEIRIRSAHDGQSLCAQKSIMRCIMRARKTVRVAIKFNDQLCISAKKIDDVWANGLLAAKMHACHLMIAKL